MKKLIGVCLALLVFPFAGCSAPSSSGNGALEGAQQSSDPPVEGGSQISGQEACVIGVAVGSWDNKALMAQDYYDNYIAPAFNVSFVWAEEKKDVNSTLSFIENLATMGGQAFIDFTAEVDDNLEAICAKCEEYGIWYVNNNAAAAENLFGYTRFGYHYRAIRGSQAVAVNMGVNVFVNCIVCYALAGGLTALSGVFNTSYTGTLSSTMSLTSTAAAFTALFPVFIANYLSRYCNISIALLVGALTTRILSSGLVILSLPTPAVTVVTYVFLLLFLIYQGYLDVFKNHRANKRHAAAAQPT